MCVGFCLLAQSCPIAQTSATSLVLLYDALQLLPGAQHWHGHASETASRSLTCFTFVSQCCKVEYQAFGRSSECHSPAMPWPPGSHSDVYLYRTWLQKHALHWLCRPPHHLRIGREESALATDRHCVNKQTASQLGCSIQMKASLTHRKQALQHCMMMLVQLMM